MNDVWSALEAAAMAEPGKELLVLPRKRYTYGAIHQKALHLSRSLASLGVGPGDVVALWLVNGIEWVTTFFAAARIGAPVVGCNTRLRAQEVRHLFEHTGAAALVLGERPAGVDFVALAYALIPELRSHVSPTSPLGSAAFPHLRHVIVSSDKPYTWFPGMLSWSALCEPVASAGPVQLQVAGEDVALIQYTSGSTGQPKGALLSHGAVVRNGYELGGRMGLDQSDRFFVPNPFFHVAGTVSGILNAITHRATLVTTAHYEAGTALEPMEREGCTARLGLDVFYQRELEHPDFAGRHLALRKGTCMGSPQIFRRALHDMGMTDIISIYALSEAAATVTTTRPQDPPEVRATTIGRPHDGVEVRIALPETGLPAASGLTGEILVRGWNVMRGYLRDPEATAQVIDADGWLHTGDLGQMDAGGNLVFCGRLKDVIRVGGENVAAAEVENLLMGHPAVKLAIVVPATDRDLGEVPIAFVELRAGVTCSAADLAAHCQGRLARFKLPRAYELVDIWPSTGSGKISKLELRERAATLCGRNGDWE